MSSSSSLLSSTPKDNLGEELKSSFQLQAEELQILPISLPLTQGNTQTKLLPFKGTETKAHSANIF